MDVSSVMFYPLLFFVLSRHISSTFFLGVSCPLYFIHESWFIHLSPAHLHPFMSRPSYFIPSFFWVLPVIFLPRFFFGVLARLTSSAFFLGSSCLSYFIHESLFIHLSAAHCTHSCLVRHISSTKVCLFICPLLIPAPGTHLRVRVSVRVASCAFSDGGRCRHIRVFSSGSLPSKKLLVCAFSCCFSLEDVVKLSAEACILISAPYISIKFFSNSLYTLFCIATFEWSCPSSSSEKLPSLPVRAILSPIVFFLSSFSWSFFAWLDSVAIVSFSKKFAHLISLCLLPGVLFKTCFGIWRRFDSLGHWPAYEALTKRWESLHLDLFSISVGSFCNISELWPLVSFFFRQSSFSRLAPVCSYNSVVCFVLFLSSHGHKEWHSYPLHIRAWKSLAECCGSSSHVHLHRGSNLCAGFWETILKESNRVRGRDVHNNCASVSQLARRLFCAP